MAQTVEELAELLDNMKLEADRNADTFDKLLQSIHNKLEFMADDTEADDLIKVYLTELKKTLEERHSLVVSEFNKIENSFKSLSSEQAQLIKTVEAKEMFDIFANNMQSIAKELYNQKELLAQYDERFAAFASDKTDKNEIITSVSAIRKDVEVVNQNFEASIADINANIQSIFKNLIVMDPTAQNDIIKRELENIYLSTNAILSALHIVDQKNDDLAQSLEKIVTKENFEQSQEKLDFIIKKADEISEKFNNVTEKNDLDTIIYKTSEISDKINLLPLREDLRYFSEKTTEISGQIAALPQKNDLDKISDKTVDNLSIKLDELSVKPELNKLCEKTDEISSRFEPIAEKSDIDNVLIKSIEISEKLDSTATKNDIELLTNKTGSIEEQINNLPQQTDLADMYQSIHEFSAVLETLRTSLTSSNENANLMIREQLDKLNSVLSAVVTENDFTGFRHDLADFIQKIIDNSVSLNDNLNINKDVLQKLITEIENLDIHRNIETIANALEGLRISFSDRVENVSQDISNISEKINSLSTEPLEEKINNLSVNLYDTSENIKNMQSEVFEKLSKDNEDLIEKIDALPLTESFSDINNSISGLRETALDNAERISKEIENVSGKIDSFSTLNISVKINDIHENLNETAENLKAFQNDVLEKLSEDDSDKFTSLHNNIDFLRETIISSQTSNETSLAEKLLALRDMITTNVKTRDEKFVYLQNKIDEFIDKVQAISGDTEIKIGNSLSEITELKAEIEQISKEFTEWNYGQEARDSKIVNMISSELGEIGVTITTLQDAIQAGVHQELAKNTELVEIQINNLIELIENFKKEVLEKEDEPSFDFETPFKELKEKITSVKQEVNLVNTDIMDALNARADETLNELSNFKAALNSFSDLEHSINTRIEEASSKNTEEINNLLNEVKLQITNAAEKLNVEEQILSAAEDIKNSINNKINSQNITEELKNEILSTADDIKSSLNDKLSSDTEDLKTLLSVAMNNDDITWAIDNLKTDISDKVSKIFNEHKNISEILQKTNELSGNNTKISELLDALNQKVDILAMSDNNDDYLVQDEIDEVKNMISSQRHLLENSASAEKVNAIESHLEQLISKIETIEATDLKDMRESILSTILNVFEQISFIEESEDIKDFVEEKTEEINQNLIEVKQQLKQIANNDDGYTYTLQDVESDIAKLRLVINELSTGSSREDISDISENIHKIVTSVEDLQTSLTQEQISDLKSDFEKLSEDILSISSRTNKLLLTSDESYNALNNGLNDFSNIVYKLEERINYLDNTEITERIEKKLDNVANVVTGSANSDKVMRQAFMYMGEWIDNTSENIDNLSEQANKINDVKFIIEKLQQKVPEQMELLNAIAERFEEQQERMDRLEMKLEKILSSIDDIDDTKLTKKVDKIDKQLTKLNNTIEKLASYVDE